MKEDKRKQGMSCRYNDIRTNIGMTQESGTFGSEVSHFNGSCNTFLRWELNTTDFKAFSGKSKEIIVF